MEKINEIFRKEITYLVQTSFNRDFYSLSQYIMFHCFIAYSCQSSVGTWNAKKRKKEKPGIRSSEPYTTTTGWSLPRRLSLWGRQHPSELSSPLLIAVQLRDLVRCNKERNKWVRKCEWRKIFSAHSKTPLEFIFAARTRMLDLKGNFKTGMSDRKCCKCEATDETQLCRPLRSETFYHWKDSTIQIQTSNHTMCTSECCFYC